MISILISVVAATVLTLNGYKTDNNKKQFKKFSKSIEKQHKITKTFNNQDERWQQEVNTTIRIPYFEYKENFNIIPFCSIFEETYKYLNNKGAKSILDTSINLKTTNTLLIYLLWNEEKRLLKYFDIARLPINDENLDFINLYREQFLNCVRKNVIKYIGKGILVAEVGSALNIPVEEILEEKDYSIFIYKNKIKLCHSLVNDNTQLIRNLYKQLSEFMDPNENDLSATFEKDMQKENDGEKILKSMEDMSRESIKNIQRTEK